MKSETKVLNYVKKSSELNADIPRSAYFHIPFCRRRCYYCDFPISVLGEPSNGDPRVIEEYVSVLCQEINITPVLGQPLETIFFGGGTPSLLPVPQLERIIETTAVHFGISPNAEISMEMDPGTFTTLQLQGYQKAGVNRVSLGVQAFQDELLGVCGRSHSTRDIFTAIELIRQVGISNLSLDLISGLPYQTLPQWQYSLETAISIAPVHISSYDLVLEKPTAFGKQYQPGEMPLPTDEACVGMYKLAQQMLSSAGYEHYEISNYARGGYQCQHNRVYWKNRAYYGFGMGAASYVQGKRFTRPRTRREYFAWVEQLIESAGVIDIPHLSKTDLLLETLMLGLRLAEGVSLAQIDRPFGSETLNQIWSCLQPFYRQGWVEVSGLDGKQIDIEEVETLPTVGRLSLTDPDGFLFSNTVLAALFESLDI